MSPQDQLELAKAIVELNGHIHRLAAERDAARAQLAAVTTSAAHWKHLLTAERDTALEKLDDLERAIADLSHPNMRLLLAERDAALGKLKRAANTITEAGYRDCGGEFWKPPLGLSPSPLLTTIDTLKSKLGRQRTELRRLNKTLRSMWDGVRFSHRVDRDMKKAAELDAERTARKALQKSAENCQFWFATGYINNGKDDWKFCHQSITNALALAANLP